MSQDLFERFILALAFEVWTRKFWRIKIVGTKEDDEWLAFH
jgi:hypothetical protein